MKHSSFSVPDGSIFTDYSWEPTQQPKVRIVVLHGMGSSAQEFVPLGKYLSGKGYIVHAVNQRCNSFDPVVSRRGHAFDFQASRADFLAWLEHVEANQPAIPLFLVGESMGGLLAIRFLSEPEIAGRFSGVILLSPVVELARPTPKWLKQGLQILAKLWPNLVISPALFVHGKNDSVPLTRNKDYQTYVETAPHRITSYTIRFTAGVAWLMQESQRLAPTLTMPLLLLNGSADIFVTPEQSAAWFQKVGSRDRTHWIFPESYHLLLHELNAEEVLEKIGLWLEERV